MASDGKRDPYAVLGVARDADKDAIRTAYRGQFGQDSAVFLPPPTCTPL